MKVLLPRPVVTGAPLRVVGPVARSEWDEVARSDPDALPSQTPQWTAAMCERGRWSNVSRLYRAPDGRRIVLPLVQGPRPMPFESSHRTHWGFGGILAEGGVRPGDVALVVADLQGRRALRTAIRPNPLHAAMWAQAAPNVTTVSRRAHVLDLGGGADAVWDRMHRQGRKAIRASERRGVEIEMDDTGRLLPVFFELLNQSQERWAEAQREPLWLARVRYRFYDSLEKWQRIQRHLGPACRVYVARHLDTPVAAGIVLTGTNIHHTRSASARDLAAQTYASEAIVWSAAQDACAAGARTYHMGESGDSAALAQFKEKLGCVPHDYGELRFERVPFTALDQGLRSVVKRAIGFRDVR